MQSLYFLLIHYDGDDDYGYDVCGRNYDYYRVRVT